MWLSINFSNLKNKEREEIGFSTCERRVLKHDIDSGLLKDGVKFNMDSFVNYVTLRENQVKRFFHDLRTIQKITGGGVGGQVEEVKKSYF